MKRVVGFPILVSIVASLVPLTAVLFGEQAASSDQARVFVYRYRHIDGWLNRPSVYCNETELVTRPPWWCQFL